MPGAPFTWTKAGFELEIGFGDFEHLAALFRRLGKYRDCRDLGFVTSHGTFHVIRESRSPPLFGLSTPELSADDAATRLCAMTTCAMTALTARHLIEARVKYEKLLAEYPSDPVARFMVDHLMDAVIGQTHSIDQQQESFM